MTHGLSNVRAGWLARALEAASPPRVVGKKGPEGQNSRMGKLPHHHKDT